jgi:hypothetical protein
VIMHNMILEDEGDGVHHGLELEQMGDHVQLVEQNPTTFEDFIQMHKQIPHRATHSNFIMILSICVRFMERTKKYVLIS